MGREQLPQIAKEMIAQGYALSTPVCLVESVSLPHQRWFGTCLEELLHFQQENVFHEKKPVIVLIGEVYKNAADELTPLIPSLEQQVRAYIGN